jgi:hypothetical protein
VNKPCVPSLKFAIQDKIYTIISSRVRWWHRWTAYVAYGQNQFPVAKSYHRVMAEQLLMWKIHQPGFKETL